MTEIPEHLLKRAQAAREKAAGEAPRRRRAGRRRTACRRRFRAAAETPGDSRIPAHLLERSRAAKQKAEGGGDEPAAAAAAVSPSPTRSLGRSGPARPRAGVPVGAGPGGHTQRLLTVVKSRLDPRR